MKKVLKLTSLMLLLVCVCTLASCSKVSQKYADKVNAAADKDEHYTYAEVIEDLGDEAVDLTVTAFGSTSGWVYAVKGCESWDDIQAKIDAGEEVEGLTVSIVNNKAVSASYGKVSKQK